MTTPTHLINKEALPLAQIRPAIYDYLYPQTGEFSTLQSSSISTLSQAFPTQPVTYIYPQPPPTPDNYTTLTPHQY